jgi:hypothetical protein
LFVIWTENLKVISKEPDLPKDIVLFHQDNDERMAGKNLQEILLLGNRELLQRQGQLLILLRITKRKGMTEMKGMTVLPEQELFM